MQSDEEIGKVAQAVPVIISRTLELFVESLLTKTLRITNSRNAKTLSPSHMKQCIMSEQRFDFLKELVRNIPDISVAEEAAFNYNDDDVQSSEEQYPDSDTPYDLSLPSTSLRALPNGNNSYVRSISLNGGAQKRIYNPSTPSVIVQTAPALAQIHHQAGHLPTKLARSESTPIFTPRGRSNDINDQSSRLQDTAIAPPICNYELLNKPIVKIDYSNVQMVTKKLCPSGDDKGSTSTAMLNLNIAPPVINIDLTNIVTGSIPTPTKISYGITSADKTNMNGNNNNSISKFGSSVNCIAEKSKTPSIPKATSASAPISESLFELDEDYDNI